MGNDLMFGSCLPPFTSCADRYLLTGYGGGAKTVTGMIELAGTVKDLKGIELVGTWHVNDDNLKEVKSTLDRVGLEVCMMVPDLWASQKFGSGGFTSRDKKIRQEAVKEVKKSIDWAKELGCDKIDLWFGQDGYDYPFQGNFNEAWQQLVELTRECADYRSDIKVCIEYKIKEPRTHIFINTIGKTLLLIDEINRDNVGVLIDVGHALAAGENVAESIALCSQEGKNKLFYMHFNDNYRSWDDDMMVGSVHIIETLEILYWLKRTGYDGWYTLDIFPYREDGVKAAKESIAWIKGLISVLEKIGDDKIMEVIKTGDATESSKLIREALCQ
jgi:xylose isomerase